ncbi:MAG: DUF721 domain-containing protein [Coriobacteriia bacterium]|nr:DUF721 domain-containing protein [Coriobacteriia bacterium]
MATLRSVLPDALHAMGGSVEDAAKMARASEVRRMWEQLMKLGGDDYILEHTNNVFILRAEDARTLRRDHDDRKDAGATGTGKQLVVYVDESIVAAELNARRELVKLQFFEHFGERIDEFKIIISRGQYKSHHPFVHQAQKPSYIDGVQPVALTPEERAVAVQQVEGIQNDRLRRAVERAMIADLEWKKGLSTHG